MARLIDEGEVHFDNPDELTSQVREYTKAKAVTDLMETRIKELKEKIFEAIDVDGETDDKGNVFLELPERIEGVVRVEKQRRVTRKLDELIAEGIIAELNLEDKLYKTVRVVDEEAIMAAYYEGEITEDQIETMFPSKVVWALRTVKG
ncbi:hypothetical protein UFOVP45_60 [uncultured Caudovirales phage]|uniref:Uncharacterized protein n=1 Tax=uncultured Caudovirales phage TaxID=2100421 RepID=A0A6J5KUZ2_9CAUD|nr:hypothetical protein UFOVP45_60 [uncultured Caudovirales phage]